MTTDKITDVNTSVYKDLNETKKAIDNKLELNEVTSDFKLQITKQLLDIAIKNNSEQIEETEENINVFSERILEELKAIGDKLENVSDRIDSIDSIQEEQNREIEEVKDNLLKANSRINTIEVRELGTLVWAYECDDSLGLYEMDGSSYEDADLSDYLSLKNLQGYTIEDEVITTPNLKGRFIGYTGALGIGNIGSIGADKTAVNGLNIKIPTINNETNNNTQFIVRAGDGGYRVLWSNTDREIILNGDSETIPNHYAMKLCIKGML